MADKKNRSPAEQTMLLLCLWVVGLGAILLVAARVHSAFVALIIPWSIAIGLATPTLRCPRCGTPVSRKKILGVTYEGPWISTRCSNCGYLL